MVDNPGAPSTGFVYREVHPDRAPPLGYVQMFLPLNTDPNALVALAIEVAQTYRITCGIGGYSFSWNPLYPRNAGHAAYRYCLRFLGVEVQAPEAMSFHAHEALPGANWHP